MLRRVQRAAQRLGFVSSSSDKAANSSRSRGDALCNGSDDADFAAAAAAAPPTTPPTGGVSWETGHTKVASEGCSLVLEELFLRLLSEQVDGGIHHRGNDNAGEKNKGIPKDPHEARLQAESFGYLKRMGGDGDENGVERASMVRLW